VTKDDDKPETVADLVSLMDQAEADASSYITRKNINYNTRFCLWAGQSDDGRKWTANLSDRKAFPWDGATDSRIRLADMVINERVRLMKNSFSRARLTVNPVETTDALSTTKVQNVLKWLLYTHCGPMMRREIELAAQARETFGLAIMGVFWRRTTRIEVKSLSLDFLQQLATETRDPRLIVFIETILDELREEEAARLLDEMIPGKGTPAAVRKLRTTGVFEYDEPYIFENVPEWVAYEPWEDIIFPATTYDLQRAPFVACRELLTEEELRERITTDNYSESWVEKAIKHKGIMRRNGTNYQRATDSIFLESEENLVEIWRVYRKEYNEKLGATEVYCTTIHTAVADEFASDADRLEYEHGLYPFVELPRERAKRQLIESRGVPELVLTQQSEIKTQRDYRADRASLTILPPLRVPANRGKLDIVLGPAKQLPERRPGEFSWMELPANDGATIEIERATRLDVDEYFGIPRPDLSPSRSILTQQDMVDTWLADLVGVLSQTLQLTQQYLDEATFVRVAGGLPQSFSVTRQDIQGKFDMALDFDSRSLDPAMLEQKLTYIANALVPLDTMGTIDRAGLIKFMFAAVDPNLAEELVREAGAATQMEVEDEQLAFAKISAGTEPVLKESGQNPQVRLQTLQQIIQSNPAVSQRYEQDQIFRAMIDARVKAFQFQLDQRENAQIGRVGATPGLKKVQQQAGVSA